MIFPFPTLPDLSVAMFLGRWPSYPDPMWNFGWSAPSSTPHQTSVPPGQFGGGDPTQAQAQAQINALQQQNALLNQQLHNQSLTHINHLQQLLLHHQVQQPPTRTPPSVQPPPSTPVSSPPEQPTLPVATPSPPIPQPTFNPEEMLNQMKTTFQESLPAAVDKAQERQSQQLSPPIPPFPTPSHSHSHLPPSTSHIQNQAHSSRRSRSLRRPKEPAPIDKRPLSVPRSARRRSRSLRSRRHHSREQSPPRGRDSSVTLRSVSSGRRSVSHGFGREDRARLHSYGHSSHPAEPRDPPRWQEKLSAYEDYSHRESQHQDSSQWQGG